MPAIEHPTPQKDTETQVHPRPEDWYDALTAFAALPEDEQYRVSRQWVATLGEMHAVLEEEARVDEGLPIREERIAAIRRASTRFLARTRKDAEREQATALEACRHQKTPTPCVYIIQLLDRLATVKIGQTKHLPSRMAQLQAQYGTLRCLAVIPHDDPQSLEKALHATYADYRVYDRAGKTELFVFKTQRARKVCEHLLQTYATCVTASPAWGTLERTNDDQPCLF